MWYNVNIDMSNPLKVLTDDLLDDSYQMIEDNIKKIDELLKIKSYDGFIGFSQGSVFARWYISLRQSSSLCDDLSLCIPPINFFISIGSFDANHKNYNIKQLKFPKDVQLYNLFGKNDIYVPPIYSKKLTTYLGGKDIEFDGKHIIPIKEIIEILNEIYN